MPVSTAYTTAGISVSRLNPLNQNLSSVSAVLVSISQLKGNGLSEGDADNIMNSYKSTINIFVSRQISQIETEQTILALSAATEGGTKTGLLTPTIDGVPVNPALASNTAEITAMIASGVVFAEQLSDLLTNINNVVN